MGRETPSQTEERLLALLDRPKSGREIGRDYQKEFGSMISYGTLYTLLRRLRNSGWVNVRESEDEDGRFRIYSITAPGLRTLRAAVEAAESRSRALRSALGGGT